VTGWRTALRMARREGRRAKGRSTLVLAMIALPVAGVAFGAVTYATFTLTPEEQADRLMGSAQMAVIWPYDGPVNQHPTDSFFISDAYVPAPAAAPAPETSLDRLLALLPAGTTAIPDQAGQLRMRTAGGVGTLAARLLNYTDPLARGIYRQLSGRAPAAANEVGLTPAAARRLGAGVGDTVRPVEGDRTFRVTGIVEEPDDLDASTIVLPTGALPPDELSTERRDRKYLVATPGPVTWEQVKQLNTHGVVALSRHVLAHPPSPDQVALNVVDESGGGGDGAIGLGLAAGAAMLEIVLLAGPAFAVGARRQRRELALVAAAGGTPAHVRRMVLANGVVLGSVAAVVGVVVGVGVAAAVRPLIEDLSGIRSGAFRVFPAALAIVAVLAVATGVLAALVPAWIASRQDVVAALAGRRGITRSRRRWVLLGAVLGVAGAAVAGAGAWNISWPAILLGLVIVELGLVLCTPALVGLVGRLGRWLPPAPRIALRDTSRNRTAAAPAISAVMAVVVASLAISVILNATDAREDAEYRSASPPGQVSVARFEPIAKSARGSGPAFPPEVTEALRSTMPVEELHEVSLPRCADRCFVEARMPPARACPYERREDELTAAQQRAARRDQRCDGAGTSYRWFGGFTTPHATFVIDDTAAGAVLGLSDADAEPVAAALRGGAVVVDDPRYLDNGRVTLALLKIGPDDPKGSETVTAPGVALPERARAPVALMTEETARSLGLTVTPTFLVATTSRMPTVEEADRAQAALGQTLIVAVERERGSSSAGLLVIAIVAGVIALVAAAVATGLAATDGRADLGTLAAVGASPRVRRALSLSQSGVIAGLGSLIGVIAGVGAALAVLFALNQRYAEVWPAPPAYPLTVPWMNVAIALLVVPLIAMLGAGLLTRSRLPIERRTT
jgi:putative ABC transport system permease protein